MGKKIVRPYLLAICLVLMAWNVHAQWQKLPGPYGGDVYFILSYAGTYWAGGDSGLFRSPDGITWEHVENLGYVPVFAAVADQDSFYIIGGRDKSELWRTTDGGQTWFHQIVRTKSPERNVRMSKAAGTLVIIGLGLDLVNLISQDNGVSMQYFPGQPVGQLKWDANNDLIAYQTNSTTMNLSFDGANSFIARTIPTDFTSLDNILITDSAIVIRVHNSSIFQMLVSFDSAQTWQTMNLPNGISANGISLLRSGQHGILVLRSGQHAYSDDYGATWDVFFTPQITRGIIKFGQQEYLLSTRDGFHHSTDAGNSWEQANQGYAGHFILRMYTLGNRLYAVAIDWRYIYIKYYYTEFGSGQWIEFTPDVPSPTIAEDLGIKSYDTLLTWEQISLDGGLSWSKINYPGISTFAVTDVAVSGQYGYVANQDKIHVLPLKASPVTQPIYCPADCYDIFLAGDTLFTVTTTTGRLYRKLPGQSNWTLLVDGGVSYTSRLHRVNGRYYFSATTGLHYSDDSFSWTTLPNNGYPWTVSPAAVFGQMAGMDSILVGAAWERGLAFSTDQGLSWWPFNSGLPAGANKARATVAANGKVYTAMSEYGIWVRDIAFSGSAGLVYRDDNQNGIQEPNEPILAKTKVAASLSNALALTDSDGRYELKTDTSPDTLRIVPPVVYASVLPAYRTVNGTTTNQDFGVHFTPDITDLSVHMTHTTVFRSGFENTLMITVANAGTRQTAAQVGLGLLPGVNFISAEPAPTSIIGDSLVWQLDSIAFLGIANIKVKIRLDADIPIGKLLTIYTTVWPDIADAAPDDNQYIIRDQVVGSYDPNDKQVLPKEFITPAQIALARPLEYTIRFQNTGNYPAERVRLLDTIDTQLNLASLRVLGASHPYQQRLINGHILEVVFDNIQLPDSTSDELNSHGFFTYAINAKPGLLLGAQILNQASIYFDFNAAIRTNIVQIEVSKASGTAEPAVANFRIIVQPNPARTACHIVLPESGGQLSLFRLDGSFVQWLPTDRANLEMSVLNLVPSVYVLHWLKGSLKLSTKLVVLY